MSRPVHLFVSSSPDLASEREALGQAVAELPVSIGWEIKHTPRPGEDVKEALAFIGGCDLYILVLGDDFAAPMGLEWRRAVDAGRLLLAYRKSGPYSPSAQEALRRCDVEWTPFETPEQLKAQIKGALAQTLLDQGEYLGLHLSDVEGLLALVSREKKEASAEPDRRRGAERGGVILGRGA